MFAILVVHVGRSPVTNHEVENTFNLLGRKLCAVHSLQT